METQYDYYQYAMGRCGTFAALEQLLTVQNRQLHRFKSVVKSAIGLCKLGVKIHKIRESETARFQPLLDEYKSSDEYKAVLKTVEDSIENDEDENKIDADPKGFLKYWDVVSSGSLLTVYCCSLMGKTTSVVSFRRYAS